MTTENLWMLIMLGLFGLTMKHLIKIARESTSQEKEIASLKRELSDKTRECNLWHDLWFGSLRAEESAEDANEATSEEIELPQLTA